MICFVMLDFSYLLLFELFFHSTLRNYLYYPYRFGQSPVLCFHFRMHLASFSHVSAAKACKLSYSLPLSDFSRLFLSFSSSRIFWYTKHFDWIYRLDTFFPLYCVLVKAALSLSIPESSHIKHQDLSCGSRLDQLALSISHSMPAVWAWHLREFIC